MNREIEEEIYDKLVTHFDSEHEMNLLCSSISCYSRLVIHSRDGTDRYEPFVSPMADSFYFGDLQKLHHFVPDNDFIMLTDCIDDIQKYINELTHSCAATCGLGIHKYTISESIVIKSDVEEWRKCEDKQDEETGYVSKWIEEMVHVLL